MWISRKHYNALNERIAEQKQQLKHQQLILDACRKIDMSAQELLNEFQSPPNGACGRQRTSSEVEGRERLKLSEEVLCIIEHQADKGENVNLMLLVQILKELRELKDLLKMADKEPSVRGEVREDEQEKDCLRHETVHFSNRI